MAARTKHDPDLVTTRATPEEARVEAGRLMRFMSREFGRRVSLLVGPVAPVAPDDMEVWGVFYDRKGSG